MLTKWVDTLRRVSPRVVDEDFKLEIEATLLIALVNSVWIPLLPRTYSFGNLLWILRSPSF